MLDPFSINQTPEETPYTTLPNYFTNHFKWCQINLVRQEEKMKNLMEYGIQNLTDLFSKNSGLMFDDVFDHLLMDYRARIKKFEKWNILYIINSLSHIAGVEKPKEEDEINFDDCDLDFSLNEKFNLLERRKFDFKEKKNMIAKSHFYSMKDILDRVNLSLDVNKVDRKCFNSKFEDIEFLKETIEDFYSVYFASISYFFLNFF